MAQAYAQANSIYNQGQQGAAQYQGQYDANQNQYQGYANQLQNYQQNLPDLGALYKQNVGEAENQYGVNPQALLQANQALAATQATMNQLPQAVQQSANGYGLTAAQEANRYQGAANNLSTTMGNQTAGVNAYQQSLQNALAQAQTGTGLTGQSEQMRLGAMGQLMSAAQAQEQQAISQIQYYRGLEVSGVNLTEGEQNALANAESAAAAAENAQTQRMVVNAQLGGYNPSGTSGQNQQYFFNQTPAGKANMPNLYNYNSQVQQPSLGSMLSNIQVGGPNSGLGFLEQLFGGNNQGVTI